MGSYIEYKSKFIIIFLAMIKKLWSFFSWTFDIESPCRVCSKISCTMPALTAKGFGHDICTNCFPPELLDHTYLQGRDGDAEGDLGDAVSANFSNCANLLGLHAVICTILSIFAQFWAFWHNFEHIGTILLCFCNFLPCFAPICYANFSNSKLCQYCSPIFFNSYAGRPKHKLNYF